LEALSPVDNLRWTTRPTELMVGIVPQIRATTNDGVEVEPVFNNGLWNMFSERIGWLPVDRNLLDSDWEY